MDLCAVTALWGFGSATRHSRQIRIMLLYKWALALCVARVDGGSEFVRMELGVF